MIDVEETATRLLLYMRDHLSDRYTIYRMASGSVWLDPVWEAVTSSGFIDKVSEDEQLNVIKSCPEPPFPVMPLHMSSVEGHEHGYVTNQTPGDEIIPRLFAAAMVQHIEAVAHSGRIKLGREHRGEAA